MNPAHNPALSTGVLTADARNRALRTLLWALVAAAVVDVGPMLLAALEPGAEVKVGELARSAARVTLQAVIAFVVRRFGDTSALPTPVPPTDAMLTASPVHPVPPPAPPTAA